MSNRLLTEREISRRKTIAIWLIGLGLISANLFLFFGSWASALVSPDLLHGPALWQASMAISNFLFGLFMVAGLGWVRSLQDRRITNFVKSWQLVIVYVGWYVIPLLLFAIRYFDPFGDHLTGILSWLVAFFLWLVWLIDSIDSVRRYGRDREVVVSVRMIQGALVALLILSFATEFMLSNYDYNRDLAGAGAEMLPLPGTIAGMPVLFYVMAACYAVLFMGLKRLIRSSLFASTGRDHELYARGVPPKKHLFSPSLYGAVAASVLGIGITMLITDMWNDIYELF